MRAVIQRVSEASVTIGDTTQARIERGLVILLGIKTGDTNVGATFLAEKCAGLRIFEDQNAKMNLNVKDVKGSVIVVSQFTLYGDAHKGNRPSFIDAARPEEAELLYDRFVAQMKVLLGEETVQTGVFRAMMRVKIVNDGPVTILIDTK